MHEYADSENDNPLTILCYAHRYGWWRYILVVAADMPNFAGICEPTV